MENKQIKIGPIVGIIIAIIMTITSVFLPLNSYNGQTGSATFLNDSEGTMGMTILATSIFLAIFAILTITTKKKALNTITSIFSILGSLLLALLNLVAFIAVTHLNYSPASGIFLLAAGIALLFISAIAALIANKKRKATA